MKKSLVLLTSSYPYGKGEDFIEPEISYLAQTYQLIIIPTYPRGLRKKQAVESTNIFYFHKPLLAIKYIIPTLKCILFNPFLFINLLRCCHTKNSIKLSIRNLVLIPKALYLHVILKKENISGIYANWLSAPTQLALLLKKLLNVPFAATGHRWDVVDANNFTQKFAEADFIRLISNYSLELLADSVRNKFVDKIHVIKLGIRHSYPLKKIRNIFNTPFKIVCVANLIPVKGHRYLIESIALLKNQNIDIVLDIYGDGELKDSLIQLSKNLEVNDRIFFLGSVEHNELIATLRNKNYDLFCLPSVDLGHGLHEGIPVSLMEAMSLSIVCLSTATGSISELIAHNKSGILVKDKNAQALADGIRYIINNPNVASDFIEEAYYKVRDEYEETKNNEKLFSMISCMLMHRDAVD